MSKRLVITIDGPAGAGKTTVSRSLAARLGYTYVDTGALYRAVGFAAKLKGIDPDDDDAMAVLCKEMRLEMTLSGGNLSLRVNGEEIADKIRTPEMSRMASAVSARPVVREFLLDMQRQMGAAGGVVLEGRDTGSVIVPDADVKFYLDADLAVRAARRFAELPPEAGQPLDAVTRDMKKRDEKDKNRAIAPLIVPDGAVVIDASEMDAEAVVACMLDHVGDYRSR
ncbi:MAG: cytidylate kinase [Deltaproteobacteria bacterium]|nr:MAG: cytidylate kinase [Deltaproteobacteria bacterium]